MNDDRPFTQDDCLAFKQSDVTSAVVAERKRIVAIIREVVSHQRFSLCDPDRLGGEIISRIDPEVMQHILALPTTQILGLSVRTRNALMNMNTREHPVETIGDLIATKYNTMLSVRNFGRSSMRELRTALQRLGVDFHDAPKPKEKS